ncbi:MAG: DUF359 domain-containing protein, partial [Candidatus Thermoplasmatota archaeon]|nr:DUF359 domain-containing protein [Candidatus Thermoplasmatota archaeon]
LPESLRSELKEPFGPVVSGELTPHLGDGKVATVGDVVTANLLEEGTIPTLMVVDGKTQRTQDHDLPEGLPPSVQHVPIKNPAARITQDLWHAIAQAYAAHEHTLVEVEGEEDLATLPAIVHAPPGTTVLYGQPGEGAVIVTVDQTTRRRALKLLAHMEVV